MVEDERLGFVRAGKPGGRAVARVFPMAAGSERVGTGCGGAEGEAAGRDGCAAPVGTGAATAGAGTAHRGGTDAGGDAATTGRGFAPLPGAAGRGASRTGPPFGVGGGGGGAGAGFVAAAASAGVATVDDGGCGAAVVGAERHPAEPASVAPRRAAAATARPADQGAGVPGVSGGAFQRGAAFAGDWPWRRFWRAADGRLRFTIQDNGVGFDVAAIESAPASVASGIGLRSIREQAASLGARLRNRKRTEGHETGTFGAIYGEMALNR